jgi:ribonuclease HI
MKQVSMYVNGHALKNPGAAGSGIVLECDKQTKILSLSIGEGTNNQAELNAVIFGLMHLKQPCVVSIYSCSQWLVKCGSGEWHKSSNIPLWVDVHERSEPHTVSYHWIKKGSHELLDLASAHANEAANQSAVDMLTD